MRLPRIRRRPTPTLRDRVVTAATPTPRKNAIVAVLLALLPVAARLIASRRFTTPDQEESK
jgi:hypothetical protein